MTFFWLCQEIKYSLGTILRFNYHWICIDIWLNFYCNYNTSTFQFNGYFSIVLIPKSLFLVNNSLRVIACVSLPLLEMVSTVKAYKLCDSDPEKWMISITWEHWRKHKQKLLKAILKIQGFWTFQTRILW